jgi:hypothetical protein
MVERERIKRYLRCTNQLSKSMDESCKIKDLRFLRPLAVRSESNGMEKVSSHEIGVALY